MLVKWYHHTESVMLGLSAENWQSKVPLFDDTM